MKKGQFYQDMVNKDLLKILGFTVDYRDEKGERIPSQVEYVRCACIVNGAFFGVQEMKVSTLTDATYDYLPARPMLPDMPGPAQRFERVLPLRELWLKWKYRDSQLHIPPSRPGPGTPFDKLSSTY